MEKLTLLQERQLAEKDLIIRALQEENHRLGSEMVQLMKENKELQKKMPDNPERDEDRDEEMDCEALKDNYKKFQKAIRRMKTEIAKEIENNKELARARDQAIDDVCSELALLSRLDIPRRLCQKRRQRNT